MSVATFCKIRPICNILTSVRPVSNMDRDFPKCFIYLKKTNKIKTKQRACKLWDAKALCL